MRGSTKKKIEKFVDQLIANSSLEERKNKSRNQLIEEVKVLWKTKGEEGQKFINKVINSEI